ncbi:metallophosphoesterase [Mycolicibacterium baixiangningiae]|nr:metallophosphoesterase [Mycolicibacterium baixiangningiae]
MRSETWFTSDLHLGHTLVSGVRGFDTTEAHDDELALRWDARIRPLDGVWVLGDISGGGRGSQRRALEWLAERPGSKHLIAGNHDGVHPMHRDAHKALPAYLDVFASVAQSARRKIAGYEVLLSHFPYAGTAGNEGAGGRYDQWRLPDIGSWLLHGHTHSSTRREQQSIHVGLDAWGLTPVSVEEITGLLHESS